MPNDIKEQSSTNQFKAPDPTNLTMLFGHSLAIPTKNHEAYRHAPFSYHIIVKIQKLNNCDSLE